MLRKFSVALCASMIATTLSGCWLGPRFYALDETVSAIPAGTYRISRIEDPTGQDQRVNELATIDLRTATDVRIAYRADGSALVENLSEGEDPQPALLVPLSGVPGFERLFAVQVDLEGLNRAIYGIVNVTDNGYQWALPACDGTRRLAEGSRAVISGPLVNRRSCRFSSREDFEGAMRQFAQDPIRWTNYRQIR